MHRWWWRSSRKEGCGYQSQQQRWWCRTDIVVPVRAYLVARANTRKVQRYFIRQLSRPARPRVRGVAVTSNSFLGALFLFSPL